MSHDERHDDRRDPHLTDRRRLLPREGGRRATDRPGLPCPFCQNQHTRVLNTLGRPNRGGYQRRRCCLSCGGTFKTFESVETTPPRGVA